MPGIHLNGSVLLLAYNPVLVSCTEDQFHTPDHELRIRIKQGRVGISATETGINHLEGRAHKKCISFQIK